MPLGPTCIVRVHEAQISNVRCFNPCRKRRWLCLRHQIHIFSIRVVANREGVVWKLGHFCVDYKHWRVPLLAIFESYVDVFAILRAQLPGGNHFSATKCRDRQNMKTCRNEGGKAKRLQIVDQPGTMTNNEAQWKTCEISVWIRLAMKISWNDAENLGWIMSRRKEKLRQFENWKSWKTKKYDLLCACEGSGRDSLPKHQGRTFNFLLHFGPHPL